MIKSIPCLRQKSRKTPPLSPYKGVPPPPSGGYVTREEPELLTDIRDFTTLLYMILILKSPEWL